MSRFDRTRAPKRGIHSGLVASGAGALTVAFFLILPLIQAIGASDRKYIVRDADSVALPEPEKAAPEPEKEEPEEEPEPPKLDEVPQLDLAQLDLALDPGGFSGDWAGSIGSKLDEFVAKSEPMQSFFDQNELDQRPRAIYTTSPALTPQMRRRAPAKVWIYFMVDDNGRVVNPKVWKSTDPIFDGPAVSAIRSWKFEPGKRGGKPVRFRMRCPITFPKGS